MLKSPTIARKGAVSLNLVADPPLSTNPLEKWVAKESAYRIFRISLNPQVYHEQETICLISPIKSLCNHYKVQEH